MSSSSTTKFKVPGQGTIEVQNSFSSTFDIGASGAGLAVRLAVKSGTVSLFATGKDGKEQFVDNFLAKNTIVQGFCRYWLSFEPDLHQKQLTLRYGCGELRIETLVGLFVLDIGPGGAQSFLEGFRPTDATLSHPDHARPATPQAAVPPNEQLVFTVQPLPVIDAATPLLVVDKDNLTMDDVSEGEKIVVAALPHACQQLYSNCVGEKFVLDTPDFPNFSSAIEQSIADPDGWCHKLLKSKDSEFGTPGAIMETYLRITLGPDAWNSPGVSYVMEVWPPGHFSPVHDHSNANAIIRVLHGEIDVKLFPYLSTEITDPFATARFKPGDVTYIVPGLNQVHQLKNPNLVGPSCITIQCYQYAEDDTAHWEYFDYISGDGKRIETFAPDSDLDFKAFKAIMRAEFLKRNTPTASKL